MLIRILFILSSVLVLTSFSKGKDTEIIGFENNKALVGESVGLVLTTNNTDISDIVWTQ